MRTSQRTRSRPLAKVVKSLVGVLALVGTLALVGGFSAASADAGRVEIDNATGTPGSNNNPHQLCGIRVEFYNFTSDTHTATVTFSGQGSSGTTGVGVLAGSDALSFSFAGLGQSNQTPDVTKKYFINTAGLQLQLNQGYHVDVDTTVDGSSAKQKVIWVQSCSHPNPTTVTPIAPTVQQSACVGTPAAPSTPTYVIPTVTGVAYSVGGHQVTGTQNATAGSTVKVDVAALAGYVLAAGAPTSFTLTFDAAPNCALPAVTPVAPTIAQSVCVGTTPSTPTYVIPTVTGVVYSQSAGTHTATPGSTVTITAAADATHRIATGAQTTFTLTFNAAPNCSVVIPTAPDLSIVKTGPSSAVLPGAQVPYTLTVRNTGTAPAANVKVTDELAAGLTLVSASGTDWVCASGSKVSCELTGLLAVGASKVVNVVTTLSATYAGATVANTAVVTPTDATPADNSSTVTTPVVGNLAISKTGTASLFPGDELVWTLTVSNTRGTTATGFTVTDALPAGTSYSSASGTDFTCSNAGQDISCVYAGSLPVGSSASIVVRALLAPSYTGTTVSNTAVLVPGRPDSNAADDTSTFVSTVAFSGGGGGAVVVPTPSPTLSPSPSPAPSGGGGGALPFTGLPADQLLLGGVLLLLAGLLLALVARRHAER